MRRFIKISVLILVVVTTFSACSRTKNTWLNRNYHNTVAYYNILWNGLETFKELLIQIESFGYDNYSHVLRVFEYGSILDTAQTNEKTNRMIEKGTKAISKHSMQIRGVEHVRVMEQAYMLIGIGYFYQHNFSMARTIFNFVSSQFPNSPIRYESLLWSARAYIQEKEYEMAFGLISQVRNQEASLYKQTYRELPAVTADFYIAQGRYNEAIPFLHEAISRSKTRDFKNRLEFILGQIYQQDGRLRDAYLAYRNVIRRNPKLELDYNARINMALTYDGAYANRGDLIQALEKMLKDTKNERFFGRIYFVLAEMALQDKDIPSGIAYLKKSVEYSSSNRDQLVISAIRLADLYFDRGDYAAAQRFYKNAVNVMTSEHPDYVRVSTRAENLTELVNYLEIVRYEEQMQYLASLPENRRDAEINRLIEEYKQRLAEEVDTAPKTTTPTATRSQQSTWYFYNEQARSFGANEFVRRWGRRANEDFWFLQQKPTFVTNRAPDLEETENVEKEEQKISGDYTPADREYYLINMPLTTIAKELSDRRLEENKFLLGIGYFDLVEEPKMGIKTLEELLVRFPNTGYRLQAYYYLYRMNMVLNNQAGMQKYRDLLLRDFPDSDQTRQITDPNYHRTSQENTLRAEQLYQYTFEAYQGGYYQTVIQNVREAERRYPGNALMPRFRFLEIMAMSSQNGVDATIENLEQYIRTHPLEKDLVELARSTIELLRESKSRENIANISEIPPQQITEQKEEVKAKEPEIDISMFKVNFATPHYCLIFLRIPEVNTQIVQTRLTDFNRRGYAQDNLLISGSNWDGGHYLLHVYTFQTASVARVFFDDLVNSKYVFGTYPEESYQIMLISAENFITLMKLRNKDAYQYFFEKHYNP
ncbi:MAG: hypothetical protein FWE63_04520 [Bacteroidales bacterium]|nr:hypothetical protein [Bacteroidales bacterium]